MFGTMDLVGSLIQLTVVFGAIAVVIMAVRALRKSAREQERIVEKLEQIHQALEKNSKQP